MLMVYRLFLYLKDSCFHVRVEFTKKLHKGLLSMRLPIDYMSILCLAANDPLRDRRTQVKQLLNMNISRRREYLKQHPAVKGCLHFNPPPPTKYL